MTLVWESEKSCEFNINGSERVLWTFCFVLFLLYFIQQATGMTYKLPQRVCAAAAVVTSHSQAEVWTTPGTFMVLQFPSFSPIASACLQSPGKTIAPAPPRWWKVPGNHQLEGVAFSNQQQMCPSSPRGWRVRSYYCVDVQLRIPGIGKS